LRDPTLSHFDTVPASDRQTDGRTDRHTMTAYTALARTASRGNDKMAFADPVSSET